MGDIRSCSPLRCTAYHRHSLSMVLYGRWSSSLGCPILQKAVTLLRGRETRLQGSRLRRRERKGPERSVSLEHNRRTKFRVLNCDTNRTSSSVLSVCLGLLRLAAAMSTHGSAMLISFLLYRDQAPSFHQHHLVDSACRQLRRNDPRVLSYTSHETLLATRGPA